MRLWRDFKFYTIQWVEDAAFWSPVLSLSGVLPIAAILVVNRPETARQEVPSRAPFVTTDSVMSGEGPIPIYGGGTVRPYAEVDVTAEISGRVVWVNPSFQSGGLLSTGEVLFRIDDADYLGKVDRARANVAAQEVELMRVTAESDIARTQFEKWENEGNTGQPSPLALWEPQIAAAQAALDRDRAELVEAELHLSRVAIYSPFMAAVLSESVAIGQFVSAGQNVGRLYSTDTVEVVVSLPDESAALIPGLWGLRPSTQNGRISARVNAKYGERHYSWAGYVDRAEAALKEQTRTIEVVIRVPRPFTAGLALNAADVTQSTSAPPLLIGKFVNVEIDGMVPDQYFRVRRSVLKPDAEVWVVTNDVLNRVPVQVLQRSEDEVFLTGPLEEGQQVVVSGVRAAIDGMAVRTQL